MITSWSRPRRVIAKVEALPGAKPNSRFLVTSLPASTHPTQESYEDFHHAKGNAENRVEERSRQLFVDRCWSNLFNANKLRLYFVAFALVPMLRLRAALRKMALERADFATLRLRLLKIDAIWRRSTRPHPHRHFVGPSGPGDVPPRLEPRRARLTRSHPRSRAVVAHPHAQNPPRRWNRPIIPFQHHHGPR